MITGQDINLIDQEEPVKTVNIELKESFENWKAERKEKKPKKEESNSWLNDSYSRDIIFGEIPKSMSIKDKTKLWNISTKIANLDFQINTTKKKRHPKNLKTSEKVKAWNKVNNQKLKALMQKRIPLMKEGRALKNATKVKPSKKESYEVQTLPPKLENEIIQSGNRGASMGGTQYSKREVNILNSLDEIVKRVKKPIVQDLIKKRQSASISTPAKELGQSKLEPHENRFMELVKRNRSQADKNAGYQTERMKVQNETGVKISKEQAIEMTKHMKSSFIWDLIKKPLRIFKG